MGWDEKDDTEYVITDDEIKEFQNLVMTKTFVTLVGRDAQN